MAAGGEAVEPDIGQIIDSAKAQVDALMGSRRSRRAEALPIPGDAVVVGEDLLDHARHRGCHRLGALGCKPALLAPLVQRICCYCPTAVEKLHDCPLILLSYFLVWKEILTTKNAKNTKISRDSL